MCGRGASHQGIDVQNDSVAAQGTFQQGRARRSVAQGNNDVASFVVQVDGTQEHRGSEAFLAVSPLGVADGDVDGGDPVAGGQFVCAHDDGSRAFHGTLVGAGLESFVGRPA